MLNLVKKKGITHIGLLRVGFEGVVVAVEGEAVEKK